MWDSRAGQAGGEAGDVQEPHGRVCWGKGCGEGLPTRLSQCIKVSCTSPAVLIGASVGRRTDGIEVCVAKFFLINYCNCYYFLLPMFYLFANLHGIRLSAIYHHSVIYSSRSITYITVCRARLPVFQEASLTLFFVSTKSFTRSPFYLSLGQISIFHSANFLTGKLRCIWIT